MDNALIQSFLDWAKNNHWQIETQTPPVLELPIELTKRYDSLPKEWLDFLSRATLCANQADTTWFLCADDYNSNQDIAFRWNEFELMSQEAAEDDPALLAEISSFWNAHLPIVLSVGSGYAYYAIDLKSGGVIMGSEPEFEEAEPIATSFEEFLKKIMLGEICL